jgi:DNA-binding NtrC family response regulator
VEDDYYLAADAARALKGAGAEVIGPCPSEEAAKAAMKEKRPDAALLDINLGAGPSFRLADALRSERIPFILATGYDPQAIPKEYQEFPQLQKPAPLRRIVETVARLLQRAG